MLFGQNGPPGFRYRDDIITPDEEARLIEQITQVEFANFEMRGVVARRRVAFFGRSYDTGGAAPLPFPGFLLPLRERLAAWVGGVEPGAFAMALINEYRAGAPIGWHRDAPQYGIVAGVSLLAPCTMKLRPYIAPAARRSAAGRRSATHEIRLERRSAYLLSGDARSLFEHHIPPATGLRYSITFRTLRQPSTA